MEKILEHDPPILDPKELGVERVLVIVIAVEVYLSGLRLLVELISSELEIGDVPGSQVILYLCRVCFVNALGLSDVVKALVQQSNRSHLVLGLALRLCDLN